MECPPTFCSQPILRPGHCCPTCEDKSSSHSCLNGNGGHSSNDSSSCLHFGSEYQNGQSWAMVDTCTSCNCRVRLFKLPKSCLFHCKKNVLHTFKISSMYLYHRFVNFIFIYLVTRGQGPN